MLQSFEIGNRVPGRHAADRVQGDICPDAGGDADGAGYAAYDAA